MAQSDKSTHQMASKKQQAVSEQLWLTYFNDSLFAKGIITEAQRNKMRIMIKNRTISVMK